MRIFTKLDERLDYDVTGKGFFFYNLQEFDDALSTISAYEKERICRLKIREQAKASLIGRLLLLYLFNSIYNIQWEAIKFERTKENKPILASISLY